MVMKLFCDVCGEPATHRGTVQNNIFRIDAPTAPVFEPPLNVDLCDLHVEQWRDDIEKAKPKLKDVK